MFRIESLLSARLFIAPQLAGQRIFFISNLSGHLSLYAMDYGGSVPEPLLPPNIALQNPELIGGHSFYVFPNLGKILVMIDHETVAQFAQERNVPFSNFASLCRASEVQDLIWGEIERVNRQLARVETVKKFRLIEQLLTPEDEELTPTMKLKRAFVNVKYRDLIDSMYERSE